jgi:polyisoprenoid-binding protein YceI
MENVILKLRRYVCVVCFIALCAPGVWAQSKTFTVAPDLSKVAFTLADVVHVHSIHGTFHIQSGSMQFDNDASRISGSIVVAAGSGQSGDAKRDRRMTMDVLEAPQFAVASFTPQNIEGSIAASGDSTVQITGIFTLHGSPHELTIPVKINIDGNSCRAKTSFLVPYVKWGLKDPSELMLKVGTVSKVVKIDLTLVGQISASPKN